ncbi:MAG TPA: HAD family hydrolase [Candidatus Angelobacter sp.]|nr:HAD family hydrolase [Candidatus Angelobacter sp.]
MVAFPQEQRAFLRPGFAWESAAAYLFDIDGTLLNSRDAVHYFAFRNAMREVLGIEAVIDGVPVHGNTDIGILRAVLRREGLPDETINASLAAIIDRMCREVESNREQLNPELCPSIMELLTHLQQKGKILGVVSGNLEKVGWLKLEKAGLRPLFSFASFSHPRELRVDIFRHGIALAKEQLGQDGDLIIVGDTPSDIEAARALRTPVIALATGTYSFGDLMACGPDACFECATDLLASESHNL